MLFITIHFLCGLALVFNTASSKQLDAKFAAATLCGSRFTRHLQQRR
jgi:hypothetical protein